MPLFVHCEGSNCRVKIVGDLTEDVSVELGERLDESLGYYHSRTCTFEINSPGGSVAALEYILDCMDKWRKKGIHFGTHAILQASSAAALLTAFGDVGLRTAWESSVLLFHESRAYTASSRPITANDAKTIMDNLKQINEKLILRLTGHVLSGLKRLPEKDLRERCLEFQKIARKLGETPKERILQGKCLARIYGKLFSGERSVTPMEAQGLLLLDRTT